MQAYTAYSNIIQRFFITGQRQKGTVTSNCRFSVSANADLPKCVV